MRTPSARWHTRGMAWSDSPNVEWTYASRKLIRARSTVLWIVVAFLIALIVPVAASISTVALLAGVVVLGVGVWVQWLIVRQVSAHAWAEREEDLIVKRGRMFRTVTVVPYGRMQFVEVQVGPISRSLGIARLQLHTASPGTDASLAGVLAADAEAMRDRLSARGEARLAGL